MSGSSTKIDLSSLWRRYAPFDALATLPRGGDEFFATLKPVYPIGGLHAEVNTVKAHGQPMEMQGF
jgi:hypothetical protein